MIITDLIAEFRNQIRDTVPLKWTPSTGYTIGQRVANGGSVYRCVGAGTSAGSSGPTGIGTVITDGSVTWTYVSSVYDPALTDDEVQRFILDGIRTYSKYRPRKRPITISVQAGVSTYPLPADWIDREYESFEAAINPAPPVDTMALLPFTFIAATELTGTPLPTSSVPQYDFYQGDLQLLVMPTPVSSYTLTFDYFAVHQADSSKVSVPPIDVNNALLPGAAKALRSIATDYSVKLQRYKMGNNIEVDNKTVADHLGKRADEVDAQFERDIIRRPFGSAG